MKNKGKKYVEGIKDKNIKFERKINGRITMVQETFTKNKNKIIFYGPMKK